MNLNNYDVIITRVRVPTCPMLYLRLPGRVIEMWHRRGMAWERAAARQTDGQGMTEHRVRRGQGGGQTEELVDAVCVCVCSVHHSKCHA